MNQSRLLERNILSDLITRNSKGSIARACYLYYREPFLEVFSILNGMDEKKAIDLYTQVFPLLCVELEANRGRWIEDGTLFDGLYFLGKQLLEKKYQDLKLKGSTPKFPSIDSDLLLQLLAEENTMAIDTVQRSFRKPAGRVFCSNNRISVNDDKLEEILEPYYEAFAIFYQKIQTGDVQPPMSASLFTYFYQFFRIKALEYNRLKGAETPIEDPAVFDRPEELGNTYFDQLLDRLGTRILPAENEKSLVQQLIGKLDEVCQQLMLGHYIKGQSLSDLGEELNLPSPKKRIHDCRHKIRKMIT